MHPELKPVRHFKKAKIRNLLIKDFKAVGKSRGAYLFNGIFPFRIEKVTHFSHHRFTV